MYSRGEKTPGGTAAPKVVHGTAVPVIGVVWKFVLLAEEGVEGVVLLSTIFVEAGRAG